MSDATDLAAAIARGQISAAAALEAARAAAQHPSAAGIVTRVASAPKGGGDGPFAGVPFLGKDLGSAAAGLGISAGNAALAARVSDPAEDSALFARFRAAGLVPFGLTAVPEFGLSLSTEPPGTPPVANPFDPTLSAGGSSGGAAAAVARGIVAMAHATDAAGSIRVPAACCGLYGLKPSRGATPMGPEFNNYLMGLVGELVLTRSLRDLRAIAQAAMPLAPAPPIRKVSFAVPQGADGAAVERAAAHLRSKGIETVEIASPDDLGAEALAIARRILAVSQANWLDGLGITEVSPVIAAMAAEGRATPATALFQTSVEMARLGYKTEAMIGEALLTPVLAGAPPKIGHFDPAESVDERLAKMAALAPNAALANAAGLPALALPFGMAEGRPVGVQIMGRPGSDFALLDLAETLRDGADPIAFPPIAGMS